jgi:phosphoribosyl-AMP cyclohydrolase
MAKKKKTKHPHLLKKKNNDKKKSLFSPYLFSDSISIWIKGKNEGKGERVNEIQSLCKTHCVIHEG